MTTAPAHLARPGPVRAATTRWPLAVLLAVVVLAALAVGVAVVAAPARDTAAGADDVAPAGTRALVADRPEVRAAALLRAWDARRAAAWAEADPAALTALYVPGSAAARVERSMLARWSARGLRVQGVASQLLDVRVLAHRPGRWELQVVDTMAGARVVGADGAARALPRAAPRTTRVVLVERPGRGWVVAEVSAVRS